MIGCFVHRNSFETVTKAKLNRIEWIKLVKLTKAGKLKDNMNIRKYAFS